MPREIFLISISFFFFLLIKLRVNAVNIFPRKSIYRNFRFETFQVCHRSDFSRIFFSWRNRSSKMDIFSYFSDAQSPIADNILPPFFPKAPKQCESSSQPFFSCLSANSTKLGKKYYFFILLFTLTDIT